MRGERDQAAAQISRVQAAITEAEGKVQEVELAVRNQWRTELSDTMSKLGSLSEGARPAWKTASSTPRSAAGARHGQAPAGDDRRRRGAAGQGGGGDRAARRRADPRGARQAEGHRLPAPAAAGDGQFSAYDFSIYGGLDAVVEYISADTVTDDKGNAFYIVRVRTLRSALGEGLPIIPGMVADGDLTGRKTVLAYLAKPVLRAKANALTER